MNIFIAGGTGAVGRSLVPMLVAEGHRVIAMTRSAERTSALERMGAEPVVGDVFDTASLEQIVVDSKPDVVIHQLTAFGSEGADPLAETIRIRIEGTRNLIAAARAAGATRFITQSISFVCSPNGTGLTDEETPLYLDGPEAVRALAESVASLEQQTLGINGIDGVVLRYGWFYGPGTNYDMNDSIPKAIRKGRMPIVGESGGTYSFVHVDDAASAATMAVTGGEPGIYNIVDDEPAESGVWLPYFAELLEAPEPSHMKLEEARTAMGGMLASVMGEQRGASNKKAKRELAWTPSIPSWREGFKKEVMASDRL